MAGVCAFGGALTFDRAASVPLPPLSIRAIPDDLPAFDRATWLPNWQDADGDCQDARTEVLIAESRSPVAFRDSGHCEVVRGDWFNRYNGTIVRSASRAAVDHLVPLANAHSSGGWEWSTAKKRQYANDLRRTAVLIAVSASSSTAKGGRGPDDWKPSNRAYWCTYAQNWVKVKQAWGLSATSVEWHSLRAMLDTCATGGATPTTSTTSPGAGSTAARLCSAGIPTMQGTVQPNELIEISGVVPSRRHPGILWVHNDSGDTPRLFALNATGAARGVYPVQGTTAFDWEGIAIGPGPQGGVDYLYVGDIGGSALRTGIQVYRVREPTPSGSGSTLAGVETLQLEYPDGPRDAEALMVDPQSGDVYVVSKAMNGASRVYRTAGIVGAGPTTMQFVRELALGSGVMVTAGDISPNGTAVILRSYARVHVFARPVGQPLSTAFAQIPCDAPAPIEIQGEAIAIDADNGGYLTMSEGWHEPIWHADAP